jgi:hypothetical protein
LNVCGYSVHHANDDYRMLNLDTKSIIQSRDIIWLNEAYHDWIEKKALQKNKLRSAQGQDELKNKKLYRAMCLLESSFNPEASTMLQNIEQESKILIEQENVALFSGIVIDEVPSSFDEAWNHDDPKARGKW